MSGVPRVAGQAYLLQGDDSPAGQRRPGLFFLHSGTGHRGSLWSHGDRCPHTYCCLGHCQRAVAAYSRVPIFQVVRRERQAYSAHSHLLYDVTS